MEMFHSRKLHSLVVYFASILPGSDGPIGQWCSDWVVLVWAGFFCIHKLT